jgi:plasmid stabilization system protein ParE
MVDPRRPIDWSPEARADLSEIWNYYVNVAGRHTADKIVREIGEVCRLLEEHPLAGRARDAIWMRFSQQARKLGWPRP